MATAVQEKTDLVLILMNDQGYGVIKNIQDVYYGGRRHYVDLHTPDYTVLSAAMGFRHIKVDNLNNMADALQKASQRPGPCMIEVDMLAIGPFKTAFAGPPVTEEEQAIKA